jgi:plasmid replication initiation protein
MTGHQVDLFLDQLVDASIKDEQRLMEFPFFALQKQPRMQRFIYDDGVVKIEIAPGDKGIATIWDKDVLIYLASLLNDRLERGAPVSRTITFSAHDFMRATGRGTGKRAYELFLDALFRLRSTTIVTTIGTGGQTERRGFGWIETWRVIERENRSGDRVMAAVEVTLNDWMFRSIVKDRKVLTINRAYFQLTMGIERRLYELARKHVGSQPDWWVSLKRLHEKCGSVDTLRKFKLRLKEIAARRSVPDYGLEVHEDGQEQCPFKVRPDTTMIRFKPLAPEPASARPPAPAAARAAAETPVIRDATYSECGRRFPGYDVDYLVRVWQEWSLGQGGEVRRPDQAFLTFCETYTRNNPLD